MNEINEWINELMKWNGRNEWNEIMKWSKLNDWIKCINKYTKYILYYIFLKYDKFSLGRRPKKRA